MFISLEKAHILRLENFMRFLGHKVVLGAPASVTDDGLWSDSNSLSEAKRHLGGILCDKNESGSSSTMQLVTGEFVGMH